MSAVDIVVVGSHAPGLFLRVKRVPAAGETVIGWDFHSPQDGGKGSNQAIAAARLGGRAAFVGCLGRDSLGDQAESWLKEAGVDTSHVRRTETGTGVGFIILDEAGVPAMVTALGANVEVNRADVDGALAAFAGAKVLLTQFENALDGALYAARAARARGLTAIVNPAPAPDGPLAGLDAADILVPNETEAKGLLGLNLDNAVAPADLVKQLLARTGARAVVVTLGEQGVAGSDGGEAWQVAAPKVQAVDTSGAGDMFCAALAVGLTRGWPLRQAAGWACKAAAVSVTRPGTIPSYPTAEEVEAAGW
jgi:ribokinase